MSHISFYSEDIAFLLPKKSKIIHWISEIASQEDHEIEEINYIFCSDEYLVKINREFLSHEYYTDIITFNNSEEPKKILSDIFISIDRVKENAQGLDVDFEHELHRVMIHGLLHLIGYDDKCEHDQMVMRQKEDACLSLL